MIDNVSSPKSASWAGIRIAYAPYHKDLVVPGDRRRFVFYANERKIPFTLADPLKKYDIVYLTYGCNLSIWINYKKDNPDVKFVFELIDSYLLEDNGILSTFRGTVLYFIGREEVLWFDYKTALRKMISICDAVVCSTTAQKHDMLQFNKNIHISLDYFSDDITHHKTSFINKNKNRLKLVWEGQSYTVKNLLLLNNVFEQLKGEIELYIITDPIIKSPVNWYSRRTNDLLKILKCKYHLVQWSRSDFSQVISNADLAIIPIESDNAMMWNKPENKLLLLWEIGVPTLTSDTPAYKRVMSSAEIDFCCRSSNDWVQKIREYRESSIECRTTNFQKAKSYLERVHNKNDILRKWDQIFESLKIDWNKSGTQHSG
jgi:hypothetical protein